MYCSGNNLTTRNSVSATFQLRKDRLGYICKIYGRRSSKSDINISTIMSAFRRYIARGYGTFSCESVKALNLYEAFYNKDRRRNTCHSIDLPNMYVYDQRSRNQPANPVQVAAFTVERLAFTAAKMNTLICDLFF